MSDEDRAVVVIERGGLGSFLIGLAAGAGLALLFAPQTGEETRRTLKNRGRQLRTAAYDALDDVQETASTGYERVRTGVENKIDDARRTVRDTKEVGAAVVHSARDELEQKLTEARDARRSEPPAEEEEEVGEEVS